MSTTLRAQVLKRGSMEELEDKILVCLQCGKDFTFTTGEQEHYGDKGWSEPRHCPKCRSARRETDIRVCFGCAAKLTKEGPAYCSTCLDNIKREAEGKLHGQQQKIEELEGKLKTVNGMDESLAAATAELSKSQQANKELCDRVKALEVEKLELIREKGTWQSIGTSVQQFSEQF